jgi:hypothetical protein
VNWIGAVILSLVIAWLDVVTGNELTFSPFYLLPVAFAGRALGIRGGIFILCAENLVVQGEVKSADGNAALAFLYEPDQWSRRNNSATTAHYP